VRRRKIAAWQNAVARTLSGRGALVTFQCKMMSLDRRLIDDIGTR
jgi:hypothetical protein